MALIASNGPINPNLAHYPPIPTHTRPTPYTTITTPAPTLLAPTRPLPAVYTTSGLRCRTGCSGQNWPWG